VPLLAEVSAVRVVGTWYKVQISLRYRSSDQVKVNQSHYRPEVPRRFQEFKVPRLRDSVPQSS